VVSVAVQKPGRSRQDYGTPLDFINAVEASWGPLSLDLAASDENHKAPVWITPEQDSFSYDWSVAGCRLMWLNPPYSDIAPWAAKCAATKLVRGSRIFLLVPASVGSNWYADHVHGKAHVLALSPRLTFEGCADPYPKDLLLAVYGEAPGFDVWRWKP
jgi:phage N-6-adenine-methyltransferase